MPRVENIDLLKKLECIQSSAETDVVQVPLTIGEIESIKWLAKGGGPSLHGRKTLVTRRRITKKPEAVRYVVVPVTAVEKISSDSEYYNVQEVAELFGVTPQAVYKWIDKNKIEYERRDKDSRDIRIPKAQFKRSRSRADDALRRRDQLFGKGKVNLTDPKEIFRSGGMEE